MTYMLLLFDEFDVENKTDDTGVGFGDGFGVGCIAFEGLVEEPDDELESEVESESDESDSEPEEEEDELSSSDDAESSSSSEDGTLARAAVGGDSLALFLGGGPDDSCFIIFGEAELSATCFILRRKSKPSVHEHSSKRGWATPDQVSIPKHIYATQVQ